MAGNQEAVVSIKLFNQDFNQSIKEMKDESGQLRKEFVLQEQQMRLTASEADKFAAKVEYLAQQQALAVRKVADTEAQYERVKAQYGETSVEAQRMANAVLDAQIAEQRLANELTQTTRALDNAQSAESQLGDEIDATTGDINEQNNSLKEMGDNLKGTGDKIKDVGGSLSTNLTAPIIAFGVAGVAAFNSVDEAVDTIITKTGATGDAAADLQASFEEVAGRVPDDLLSVGEAIGEVNTQFGFLGTELEDNSQLMLQFASINGTDVTSASIAAKKAIEAYGLANGDLNNVLDAVTKTAQDTGQAVDFLFDKAIAGAPQIKALGLSFEEGTALIGGFEKAGVDSSASLASLSKAQVVFAKDGKTLEQGLNDTIKAILGAKSETEALTLASEIFGTKGATRMVDAIGRGTFNLDEFSNAGANAAGAVKTTFEETVDPIDQAAIAMNNAKLAMGRVGDAIQVALLPFFLQATGALQKLTVWFDELSPAMINLILIIGGIVAAIGPLLVGFGMFISSIGSIMGFIGPLVGGITQTGGVLAALTGPIGIAIAAIAGLIAIGILVYQNWDTVKKKALEVWNGLVPIVQPAIAGVVSFVTSKMNELKTFWNANGQQLLKAFTNIWNGIKAVIDFVMPAILFVIKMVWENIKGVINGAMNIIKGLIQVFAGLFTGDFSKMWEGIKNIFKGAIEFVWNLFNLLLYGRLLKAGMALFTGLKSIFTGGWSFIKSSTSSFFNWIQSFASSSFSGMRTIISNTMTTIRTTISTKWTEAVNFLKAIDLKQIGKNIIEGLVNGIKSTISSVLGVITELASNIPEWAKKILKIASPSRVMFAIGRWIGIGNADGIASTKARNESVMKELSNVITNVAKSTASQIATIGKTAAAEQSAISKKAATDIAAISKQDSAQQIEINRKATSDIAKIHEKAHDAKRKLTTAEVRKIAEIKEKAHESNRKLTSSEVLKIEKIENDADAKILSSKKKAKADIAKVEEQSASDRLSAIQKFIDNKQKIEGLSLIEEANIWRKAADSFKNGTQEKIDAHSKYRDTLRKIDADITSTNEKYAKRMTDINQNLTSDIAKVNDELVSQSKAAKDKLIADEERLNDAYAKTLEDRYKSLKNFAGLFEKFDIAPKESGNELLSNLHSQVDGFKSWESEITKLSSKAIDQGLIDELRDMGPKALPQLIALNSLTDEQLTQYSALYLEKSALARAESEEQLIGMKADTQYQISELRVATNLELDRLNTEAQQRIAGLRLVANNELASLKTEWVAEIASITKATDEEFKTLTQIGIDAGQRLLDGMKSMQPALVSQATAIAKAVNAALQGTTGGSVSVPKSSKSQSSNKDLATQLAQGASISLSGKTNGTSGSNSKNYNASVVNNYHVPVVSPAEQARKQKQTQRQLAMEWGG
ncbi:hypothetical protein ACFPYN_03075 [Paenisporosarcina macmurdoensis]|uniref:Phage tail tape measure protein domain-containing protein n=1 Tax=Paenisporosarcina macmurdoensis TaxID=212659 RepID=A0ABW1L487_9BACL